MAEHCYRCDYHIEGSDTFTDPCFVIMSDGKLCICVGKFSIGLSVRAA